MNMQKYQLLLTVVDMGSITRAAEHLNYTQSAVSQALLSLEREWGFQLLERSRTGVGLTPNAQAILPYLREICNSQQALEGAVSRIAGIQTGLIRIGAITSLSCQWLPPALKQFHLLHPGVRFDLRQGGYTDIEQLLGSGEIDVGFSVFRSLKQWDAFPLGEDRMLAVLPRDHKLAQFEQVPLKLLGEEPFILLEEGDTVMQNCCSVAREYGPISRCTYMMTAQSWRWWKMVWGSVCCLNWYCAGVPTGFRSGSWTRRPTEN